MQGSIYISFSELVTEQFGLLMWDTLLAEVSPASGGVYTSGQRYGDEELFALAGKLSEKTDIPLDKLVRVFGEYLFKALYNNMPTNVETDKGMRHFLLQVDSVIHKEVYRLFPDALLPSFEYKDDKPNELLMRYRSPRKLCSLCEGLLDGVAKEFKENVIIEHPVCMHNGSDYCDLYIKFQGSGNG